MRNVHLRGRGPHIPPLDRIVQYDFETGYVVFTMPCAKRLRVDIGGETVADTINALFLYESDHLPAYYFPQADIRLGSFRPSALTTHRRSKPNTRNPTRSKSPTAPSKTSRVRWTKSSAIKARSGSSPRFSVGRHRWNWNTGRSRKCELQMSRARSGTPRSKRGVVLPNAIRLLHGVPLRARLIFRFYKSRIPADPSYNSIG